MASGTSGEQVAEAVEQMAHEASELLRDRLRGAGDGLRGTARRMGVGGALLGGAGVCGALAVGTAHRAALNALETALPRAQAAAVLSVAYAVGAGALARLGRDRLRGAGRASGARPR
ncbi:phage holin family protein [Streptomyces sp. TRM43335]|uniref:Phage holin family protein n=1 Tax=Streptomyces taklimakanensis TaxID=2569853 RepID=A0A6G2B744_9ACTN|nr:phage holin family protein [Streptomyces taklimakanensis]MTE18044.1 phage holin family protein [Streptomyces taklimakanensis]